MNHYKNDPNPQAIEANIYKHLDHMFTVDCSDKLQIFLENLIKTFNRHKRINDPLTMDQRELFKVVLETAYDDKPMFTLPSGLSQKSEKIELYKWDYGHKLGNRFTGAKTILSFIYVLEKLYRPQKDDDNYAQYIHCTSINTRISRKGKTFNIPEFILKTVHTTFSGHEEYRQLIIKEVEEFKKHKICTPLEYQNPQQPQQPVRGGCEKTNTALLIVVIIILIVCMIIKKPVFAGIVVLVASIYYIYHREDACV